MGDLVEFPKRLEWRPVDCWVGHVKNTKLVAKVEATQELETGVTVTYTWTAWANMALVGMGTATSLEGGKEAAKKSLEQSVLVVRGGA